MSEDHKPRFPPLNDTNFSEWSIRMEAELIRKDLWGMVKCHVDMDGKDAEEEEKAILEWRRKRTKRKITEAYAEIVLRVEDSQLAHMRSRDPEIIWETLAGVHQARGLATRLALRRKFLTGVKGAEGMSAYIGKVRALSYRLEDIGVTVTDEDMILALTMGLDTSYESFIISLDSTPSGDLDVDHVISRIINEEVRRENVETQGVLVRSGKNPVKKEDTGVAMAATAEGSGRNCWRCGKAGHVKAFCKEKPASEPDTANVALAVIGIESDDDVW